MEKGLNKKNRFLKRSFDLFFSIFGLTLTWWIIIIAWVLASIDTKSNGFFLQNRVGMSGKNFKVIKIKTMKLIRGVTTTVTTDRDPRITKFGKFFRKTKIDELPQLINVLLGQMSFVGPRPDVPEMFENLSQEDKLVLTVRPGITGPATLKYRYEEQILASVDNPEDYNKNIIFKDKLNINKNYIRKYRFINDIYYILDTIFKKENTHYDISM